MSNTKHTPTPIALPVTQGSRDNGFNANVLYDVNDTSIATVYGLPQSTTLEELGRAVERREFNGAWVEGAARAAFIVRAVNTHEQLVSALRNLIAASDAYSTVHAPDGDDAARMVEYAAAFDNARAALAAAEA